ncbi:MAG: hypothetical protein DCC55_07765 [Chloroflexi bacterium]|nr:MAG: hypothetical protein DCC55_07765 [Chloroflexota bacterium]
MKLSFTRRNRPYTLLLVAGLLALGGWLAPRATGAIQPNPVTAAWEKARAAGSYHFSSDVTQMTIPVAKVTNVGRQSRTDQLRLEGATNLKENRLEMRLWSEGGNILQNDGEIAIKIEDGKSYLRRGATEPWQDQEGILDGIAPQGDFLAYLAAVRDIQANAPERRGGIEFTRYRFTLHGPTFAAYMRDRMTAALRARGATMGPPPPGVNLTASDYFGKMTGDGELWVGADGLPLRQILKLHFPEQRGQRVSAQIVVDFSRFGQGSTVKGQSSLVIGHWSLGEGLVVAIRALTPFLALLTMTVLVAIILYYRRARVLQTALATAVILSMVVGPLLSTFQVDAFFAAQAAKAAAQEEAQAAADTQRDIRAALGAVEFNPLANPLESTELGIRNTELGISDFQLANLSVSQSPNLQLTDNGVDSDGDGLSDFVEVRVGTNPDNPDSDEDGVSDAIEVRGVLFGGQTWYGDAQNADSNNDGIPDGQEWDTNNDGQIDDTDNDGIPDAFDPDNDNDGVPDRLDLSPFTASNATYTEASPLQLTINQLTADKPTFVDFQLRPQNPAHLWYSFSVLDWPGQDSAGQVQDIDNKTFADFAIAQGRTPAPGDADGDMKLIPMLEIRIQGSPTNLPAQSELTPYNISVQNYSQDGSTKLVYVPLNLVTDEQTGQRVAFTGRMRYLPQGSWPTPHQVRLVWVVQMLVDLPCDRGAPNAAQQGCGADGYIRNIPQVVQSYYEQWRLTGLNISEQHGAKTALIYEDPARDTDHNDDASLVALAHALDHTFLAGRDQDGNLARDVTIDNLAGRADYTQNGGLTSDQRWGLDGSLNTLRVERHDYATFDQAAVQTAMTTTLGVLNKFNAAWNQNFYTKPTLMWAYEQRARALSLDASRTSGGYVVMQGNGVTANLLASGPAPVQVNLLAGFKWTHYCRPEGATAWATCSAEEYWQELYYRYNWSAPFAGDPDDPDVHAGRLMALQIYDRAVTQGVNRVVEVGNQIVPPTYMAQTDAGIAGTIRSGLQQGVPVVKFVTNMAVMNYYKDKLKAIKGLGILARAARIDQLASGAWFYIKNIQTNKLAGSAVIVLTAAVVAGLVTGITYLAAGYLADNPAAVLTVKLIALSVTFVMSVLGPTLAFLQLAKGGFTLQALAARPELISNSRMASAVGAGLAIGITWGFFIYNVTSNDLSPGTVEFSTAVSQALGATIYLILVAVISSTVVGLLIAGVLAVTDAILTLVCELGTDRLRGSDGACFTIAGTIINAIASGFYSYEVMVETNNRDLIVPGSPTTSLANPDKGFVGGNNLSITLPITNTVRERGVSNDLGHNFAHFTDRVIQNTTFRYSLTQPGPVALSAEKGEMFGAWGDFANIGWSDIYEKPLRSGRARTLPAPVSFDLQPGLNRPAPFYLNMGYALPAFDCWKVWTFSFKYPWFIKVTACTEQTVKGNNSSKIETLRYDIFPASLGGFMALGSKANGVGLAWDARFGALRDADGDGLLAASFGGLDPDDRKVDTDQDGLTDAFELERRAAGQPYSPVHCDSDGDGLTDRQEAFFGANPALRDTDNDGLSDGEEVWHQVYDSNCQPTNTWIGGWTISINGAGGGPTIRVNSNPVLADSDGDGMSDLAERQLAGQVDSQNRPYHPSVVNIPPLAVYTTSDKQFVAPGQDLVYHTTVVATTPMAPGVLDVSIPSQLGQSTAPFALNFNPLTFSGAQTLTQQINLSAQPGLSTQKLLLSSSVRTRLAPSGPSALAWDPISFQSLGTTPPNPQMAMAASLPDRPDNYLISTLSNSFANSTFFNTLLYNAVPGGQSNSIALGSSSAPFINDPPDIACNNNGVCLSVTAFRVDQPAGIGDLSFAIGTLSGAEGQGEKSVLIGVGNGWLFRPVVASDGANFLVAYESSLNTTTSIIAVSVDAAGNVLSNSTTLVENPRAAVRDEPSISMDLAWLGNRYGLVWKFNRARGGALIPFFTGVINPNATVIGSLTTQIWSGGIEIEWDASGALALAYDPINNRTLLTYRTYFSNSPVAAFLFQGSNITSDSGVIKSGLFGDLAGVGRFTTVQPPKAAYNPIAHGWLVHAGGVLYLFRPDISGVLLPTTNINVTQVPLACPLPSSVAVTDLRFEDAPGTTTFANSSVFGGSGATCTAPGGHPKCPAAGLPGATDAQGIAVGGGAMSLSSDYSVRFDGGDDELLLPNALGNEFSLAFWYKAQPTNNGASFAIESGQRNGSGQSLGFGLFLNNHNSVIQFDAGGVEIHGPAPASLTNGQWHFIVATRKSTGALAVYFDGNPTPFISRAASPNPVMGGNIRLGDGGTTVSLDNFQLYKSALSGATVQALYNRTLQSYCTGVNNYRWAKFNASRVDTRGGKLSASNSLTITIDADKPTASISGWSNGQWIKGNTVHNIGGAASDGGTPSQPTSGVAQVEIQINTDPTWLLADGKGNWFYNLPVTHGEYLLRVRATDGVGNVGDPSPLLTVVADGELPLVTLNAIPTAVQKPTRTVSGQWQSTFSGTIIDHHSGMPADGVEVRLVGQDNAAGNGWQAATINDRDWSINYRFAEGLADPTGTYTVSVRATDNVGNRTADNGVTGILRLDANPPTVALSATDAQRTVITGWAQGATSEALTLSGVITDTGAAGIDKVEVAFVPYTQIAALPANLNDDQADAQLNRTWLPATVAQPGATVSGWSLPLPAGLEDEYQIDLRASDRVGNVVRTDNVWSGVIDVVAPRVTASAVHLDGRYVFPNRVECSATDRYIDESKFDCPIYNGAPPLRTFDNNPALQAIFPDRTILVGLSNSHTYWSPIYPAAFDVTACDHFGQCTTVNSGPTVVTPAAVNSGQLSVNSDAVSSASVSSLQSPISVSADAPGATMAAVVSPAPGNVVAADDTLNVTVAAESSALLKEVTVHLDGNLVQTLNFAQSENATRILRTFQLTGVSEGQHTFIARATDWAGGVQDNDIPVTFTVDRQAPTVTIDPATLTNADTWGVGSEVLRFKGTASDSIGLAAVQIREGAGVFIDVQFGDGVWQSALSVQDPEGRTLNITVRAIDRAGRISEVTQSIGTALSTANAPDTTITQTPANPSASNTATFAFSGSETAVLFKCQVDDEAYTVCANPKTISDLSKGEHTFRVRAIDGAGNVDLTPASYTWTVNASALDATITGSPANPRARCDDHRQPGQSKQQSRGQLQLHRHGQRLRVQSGWSSLCDLRQRCHLHRTELWRPQLCRAGGQRRRPGRRGSALHLDDCQRRTGCQRPDADHARRRGPRRDAHRQRRGCAHL